MMKATVEIVYDDTARNHRETVEIKNGLKGERMLNCNRQGRCEEV